jgi:hypothetical protein
MGCHQPGSSESRSGEREVTDTTCPTNSVNHFVAHAKAFLIGGKITFV